MVNWNCYLESLRIAYAQWSEVYTLTDVVGRQRIEPSPLLLDFMVQTVPPDNAQRGVAQQKTERLGVVQGLLKYAPEHVLLVGRPGSGKSTALARLLLEEAGKREKQKIPVLVRLRYYKTSVLDLIRSFLKEHALLLEKEEIETLLFEPRFLLLVDGLNELPSEEARRDLMAFRRENAATPMIFTTRDLGVGGDLNIVKKLEMQPLTEVQMCEFVWKYIPEQGEQMLRQLGKRLQEFGQTPLLLLMLCSVFKKTGKVPPNLGLVLQAFTQIYEHQLKQDAKVTAKSRRWWPRLLRSLAFEMSQGQSPKELRVAIPRAEVEEFLTKFLQDKVRHPDNCALSWLQDLLHHHLIQLKSGEQIEFRHQLIQEYYTAESLLKQLPQLSDDSLKREYLNYLKWTEPLALMLELVDNKAQVERVVRLALEVDLRLGARLAGAVKPEFQEKTIALVAGLEIPQKVKIELLGITHSDRAIPALMQALNDKDSSIRLRAAAALREIGNEAAVSALLQALNNEDFYVRMRAAAALREIGNEAAVSALLQALKHEDSDVRWNAAIALGEIGNEAAISALLQALNDENFYVRISAAGALGEIGNEAAVPALLQALNDEDFYVRISAAGTLGEIGSEAAVTALLEALNDEDPAVRISAAGALGKIGNEAAVTALLEALNDEDPAVCTSAADALGKIGNEAAISALMQALNDEDFTVRRRAAYALGEIGNEAAVPVLLQALNDEDPAVRTSAADALGKMGNEAAVTGLLHALNDKDSIVRRRAAYALGEIGNEAVVTALLHALNDEDPTARTSAADALGEIGNEAAVPVLLQALNDEDPAVRTSAADALGKIGNEAAAFTLLQALNNDDSAVRTGAAYTLGEIGNEAAVTGLLHALNDDDSTVRRIAADALGKIGNEATVVALLQALNDDDSVVCRMAAGALGKIDSPESLPRLSELILTTEKADIADIFNTIAAIKERCKYYNHTLISPEIISIPSMYILHLSDLHFGTADNARNWYSQLAEDLHYELNCPRLDVILLSGDIANKSTPEEYKAAHLFLDNLRQEFQLQPQQIVIVPGNHDLNWGLAKKAYSLERREDYQSELQEGCFIDRGDIIEVRDEAQYQQRFAHFRDFYQAIKDEPYPLEYEQQGILHHFPEQNLLILGLNSAWQLDHHYKSRASIHPDALSTALTQIRQNPAYSSCLKMVVWHHPLTSAFEDRITDHGFMEQLAKANFRFALHGHIHKAENSLYRYDLSTAGRKLDIVCAGTFGAPIREWVPGYPLQYNLLKLEGNKLTVMTRRREELNGAWKPDARWLQGAGQNPLPYYEIPLCAE